MSGLQNEEDSFQYDGNGGHPQTVIGKYGKENDQQQRTQDRKEHLRISRAGDMRPEAPVADQAEQDG